MLSKNSFRKLHSGEFTHPDDASLVDPLFACGGKKVKKLLKPSFPLVEERVVERSNDRASNYMRDITANG